MAVEDPGSRGAREEIAHWGLRPVPVAVDEHGLNVDALQRTGVSTALLTPAHQFPTGVVLSPARALLEWARAARLVIEDDYDAEHRYDRAPVRALQSAAPDHVAHTGSTSKTVAPGLRLVTETRTHPVPVAAGLSHRATCTLSWSPPGTPATSAVPPCLNWCSPT